MKKTRLNERHKELGGKMIDFFGWEMPVEFSGVISEHLAVRNKAGLFDVSHMGEVTVKGNQALDCVQYLTPNDASRLKAGKVQYTALTTEKGTFVDDMLVYCLEEGTSYLMIPNASNQERDYAWVRRHGENFDVEVQNRSSDYTQLALQGPQALKILNPLIDVELEEIKPFRFRFGKIQGENVLVSRTGYTGEDGFELYTLSYQPQKIWDLILEKGESEGLIPVGLGARDTLRMEAFLMLYGNDIDETTSVLEARLGWLVKFKKGNFLGREALLKEKEQGVKRKIVGFELIDRGIARPHYPVYIGDDKVSEVTSGSYSPYLKKSIGMTYLPVDYTEVGTEFEIGIRNRKVKAKVVPIPFYKRKK
ncbi:glycine cleavage system aminomethyltransferase GcvT [bacterium]|nr:glycine cleavage system aminomethyltransferase GcvT [bacterium]